MAPPTHQLPLLLLLLSAAAVPAVSSSSSQAPARYSFPVFDGKSTADGVVVATNSAMLAPATFLFDAQLFPEFNHSEGFVLLSRAVALWRAAAAGNNANRSEEASFSTTFTLDAGPVVAFVVLLDSFPPFNVKNSKQHGAANGSALASAAGPRAANSLATVEVSTVSSYGPPGVGLNVTITPNRSAGVTHQLAVRIGYDATAHMLSVYVDDAAAGDPLLDDSAGAPLLEAPLDLAGRLPTQAALVGFFAATVRDVVVGVRGWELTVDALPDDDGDGPARTKDGEQSPASSTPWLVVLFAVLGSVAAVGVAVVSVMLYRAASRRRAVDMEVQKCYREYFARMTH